MRFILFLDAVGAEFTKARITRKGVVAAARGQLLRFRPTVITPLEVIDETGGARRAAGGFILLGPLGAALGVLTGKGPQVLFELTQDDGTVRKGVIAQRDYPWLRREIEKMQTYKSGEFSSAIVTLIGFLLLVALFVAVTGPLGFLLGPAIWFGAGALLNKPKASA